MFSSFKSNERSLLLPLFTSLKTYADADKNKNKNKMDIKINGYFVLLPHPYQRDSNNINFEIKGINVVARTRW